MVVFTLLVVFAIIWTIGEFREAKRWQRTVQNDFDATQRYIESRHLALCNADSQRCEASQETELTFGQYCDETLVWVHENMDQEEEP